MAEPRRCRRTIAATALGSLSEYGHSQSYEVSIQLCRGKRLTRNWFNNGLHFNGVLTDGDTPGCLTAKVGEGSMAFLHGLGNPTDDRDECVGGGPGFQTIPSGGFGLPRQTAAGEKT
jgi:hypothetical protein